MNSSDYFNCHHCFHIINNESSLITHVKRKHLQNYSDYRKIFGTQTQKQINGDGRSIRWKGIETPNSIKKAKKKKHVHEMITAGFIELSCKLCDFTNMISITTHVTRKHNMSTHEYLAQFPDSKLYQSVPSVATATAEKLRHRHLTDPVFHQKIVDALPPLPSKIEFWTSRDYSENDAITQVSAHQSKNALMGGEEKLKKLSAASTGDRNPMSLASIAIRYGVSKEEASKLTPCFGRNAEKHPMFGKRHTQESLEKIASSQHLTNPSWRSKPEIEIAKWFKSNVNPNAIENAKINRWNIDILCEDKMLIVELFGDFWHMNPIKFQKDDINKITKKSAQYAWEHDARKIEHLQTIGYNVIIVWESDWKEHPNREKERIINAYNRTL